MTGKRVAVLFGGRSVEHEVSIITGHQIMDALEVAGFDVLPLYISKAGSWYSGEELRGLQRYREQTFHVSALKNVRRIALSPETAIRHLVETKSGGFSLGAKRGEWADVFFPALHGSFGEDGTLQGLFELADVPYTGSGVLASSVGMNKAVAKRLFRESGLPVLDQKVIRRADRNSGQGPIVDGIEAAFSYPVIVKPVSLGSSIGVRRCNDRAILEEALDVAFTLDDQVLVEPAIREFIEINCSVSGPPMRASVCEQPVNREAILSFDDKYRSAHGKVKSGSKGSGEGMASAVRIIPAPIPDEMTVVVQQMATRAFEAIDASGVARVDFLVDKQTNSLYVNEINTLPGSLAYYLWEASGVSFDELVAWQVRLAMERHDARRQTEYSFEANLLSNSARGR